MGFSSSRRMRRLYGTGLLVGFALTCALAAILFLGFSAGLPFIPFDVFDWVTRILPGRLVIFGVETMSSLLQTLGFNIKDTAKTTEHLMAVAGFLATGAAVGLVFFAVVRAADRVRAWLRGSRDRTPLRTRDPGDRPHHEHIVHRTGSPRGAVGPRDLCRVGGRPRLVCHQSRQGDERPSGARGAASGEERRRHRGRSRGAGRAERRSTDAPGERPRAVDRRRFLIQLGGATAAITLVGAGLGAVLRTSEQQPGPTSSPPPDPLPQRRLPVEPVPGTRPEYTPVADHYRIDIDAVPPNVDGNVLAAQDLRPRLEPAQPLPRPDRRQLPAGESVRHARLRVQPRRRASHRDHPVDRSPLPGGARGDGCSGHGPLRPGPLSRRLPRDRGPRPGPLRAAHHAHLQVERCSPPPGARVSAPHLHPRSLWDEATSMDRGDRVGRPVRGRLLGDARLGSARRR